MNGKATQAPLRLGIAGCGRIVERGYLPALRDLPGVEPAAVCDPDLGRATRLAAVCGAASHRSLPAMLDAGGLDAVVVATPAASHAEAAGLIAAAGLPSLVEKPPAPDLAGANALAALDPEAAIGFNRRFLQGAALLPRVPASGWLELDLEMRFRREGWGAHASRDEALLDAGTHLIDLAAFLTGSEPIAVRAFAVEPERAELELELSRARARIRCATDRPYAERVEVRERGGRLIAAARTDRFRARLDRMRGGEDPLVASLRGQLECFAAAARGGDGAPLADAAAGARTMAVVEAAHRSAALGGAEVTVTPTASADGPKTADMKRFSARRSAGAA